jgi:hypothetical protein
VVFHKRFYRFEAVRARIEQRLSSRLGRRLQWSFACIAYLLGAVARYCYIMRLHPPRNYVISDARQLTDLAERLVLSPASQSIYDTIWPPGASAVFALSIARDPTMRIAALVQLALSCVTPLFLTHSAFIVGGPGVAAVVLTLTSLHFGLIHYAGFFLSEQLFQTSVAMAIWVTIYTLRSREEKVEAGSGGIRVIAGRLIAGCTVGLAWALATAFRPNAMPVCGAAAVILGLHWVVRRRTSYLWILAGGVFGFALLIAPLSYRCSSLRGKVCLVSTNGPLNMALGQLDSAVGMEFYDPTDPYLNTGWVPPALMQHDYRGMIRVPFTMYDTAKIYRWIWKQLCQRPLNLPVRMVRNVIDLFRPTYWPGDFGPLSPHFVSATAFVILFILVIPGIVAFLIMRPLRLHRSDADGPLFLYTAWWAVLALAAMTLGEPRYRFPFDGVLLLFGAFVGSRSSSRKSAVFLRTRWAGLPYVVAGTVSLAIGILIAGASLPGIGLAALAARRWRSERISMPTDGRAAAAFEKPVAAHTDWNAPGNYRFECRQKCTALILRFDGLRWSPHIEVSVDNNDRYAVTAYKDGFVVGRGYVARTDDGPGLRVATMNLVGDVTGGYDSIGVLPLYGDGAYSLGHLRVLE